MGRIQESVGFAGFAGCAEFDALVVMAQASGADLRNYLLGRLRGRGAPLRIASDQSGASAAELAFAQIGISAEPVFLSDTTAANQRFLTVQCPSTPVFTNLGERSFSASGVVGAAVVGVRDWPRAGSGVREVAAGEVDVRI